MFTFMVYIVSENIDLHFSSTVNMMITICSCFYFVCVCVCVCVLCVCAHDCVGMCAVVCMEAWLFSNLVTY